jgi:hypothetical protein
VCVLCVRLCVYEREREIERVFMLVCEKEREGRREGGRDCVVCVRVQVPLAINNSV